MFSRILASIRRLLDNTDSAAAEMAGFRDDIRAFRAMLAQAADAPTIDATPEPAALPEVSPPPANGTGRRRKASV